MSEELEQHNDGTWSGLKKTIVGVATTAVMGLGTWGVTKITGGESASAEWKELLLLMLGAFIGSYGKIIDYWFSDTDKDKMLVQKMDEEDGVSMSHTNDMKETNKPVTPLIPDAFIQGAQAARELAVVENKQNFDLKKDEQEHRQMLEVDEQEHEQEMEKLKLEHELKAHRYCQHVWGDSDNDGELECQNCGLLKDKFDETH